jgi:glycine/D-amino acid oxidase-like deaminating enzyme
VRASPGHVVVVGGGVFGATGALELRSRGWAVTLLDPHPLPYAGASSTDVSKLVRMDYGSDVFYHELAEAAIEGWEHWNATWPAPVYHEDGLLVLSRGPMTPGGFEHHSWRVLCERGHGPERLDAATLARRFPAWSTGVFQDGYFNRRAGWVESRLVVERLVELARMAGVTFVEEGFASLADTGSRLSVATSSGARIEADRVVVCAGAWTPCCCRGSPTVCTQPPNRFCASGLRIPSRSSPRSFPRGRRGSRAVAGMVFPPPPTAASR